MKPIELEIFFVSEVAEQFLDLDIVGPVSINDRRLVTFYSIDAISPWYDQQDNNKEYCQVISGGLEFVCVDDYKTVKKLIENGL